jgi:prevent-host-death family protein
MTALVNIQEAQARLSQLIEMAERGEPVTIARAGKPVARLVAVTTKQRRLGLLEDQYDLPAWLDEPTSHELTGLFEHGDLIAQARCENALLLTSDALLARYGDHVRIV